jgi:pyruvate/oxaloacetate carboxyltransferase
MKYTISIVLPLLLVSSLAVQAQESGRTPAATSAEIKKTVLIQDDSRGSAAVADTAASQRQTTGKSSHKFKFLQATRHALENIIISDQEPEFTDSDYVATNELCTYNRAAYTYTCH